MLSIYLPHTSTKKILQEIDQTERRAHVNFFDLDEKTYRQSDSVRCTA